MTDNQSARRLGSMVPMLLFILFFVMCSGVLAAVFLRSAQISARAGDSSNAVQLCRNQAERFRSGEAIPEGTHFYGDDFAAADAESGAYRLEVTYSREGALVTAHLSAFTAEGIPLYALEVARYEPEGR